MPTTGVFTSFRFRRFMGSLGLGIVVRTFQRPVGYTPFPAWYPILPPAACLLGFGCVPSVSACWESVRGSPAVGTPRVFESTTVPALGEADDPRRALLDRRRPPQRAEGRQVDRLGPAPDLLPLPADASANG